MLKNGIASIGKQITRDTPWMEMGGWQPTAVV
jgi:hypothetical protein